MTDSGANAVVSEQTQDEEVVRDLVTQTFPPSHILQDGRFIYLPEPSDAERSRFLERSIARHGLLTADLKSSSAVTSGKNDEEGQEVQEGQEGQEGKQEEKKEDEGGKETKKDETNEPVIHPLAVASAKLQASGISELSKAINLSSLVSSGDYFSLSNIVNPLLEVARKDTEGKPSATPVDTADMQEDQRLRASYIGKRKRAQFEKAEQSLERHQRRMAAAITAQTIVDQRLLQLRPQWRLVAPEHGTRAKPHPVRPTEVVSIDVDVYDRDRTGGGSLALLGNQSSTGAVLGRLARKVPRYATVELPKGYKVKEDLTEWKQVHSSEDASQSNGRQLGAGSKTRAEPFAVADPTLGKIDTDFDPDKVPMLSLQLDIEKDSTGFSQSACLSPLTLLAENASEDEKVVVALQHSLFCASLFESVRKEIVPFEDTMASNEKPHGKHHQNHVWLSNDMEENFLPPPSLMAGGEGMGSAGALCVVHCHEGEVKVQLDVEYSLTIKLVEASDNQAEEGARKDAKDSGSQSPEQLHVLCRALLLHAQDVYHSHSIETRAMLMRKKKKEQESKQIYAGHARKQQEDEVPPARILQKCVCLGSKLLFERKIRLSLSKVKRWLSTQNAGSELEVEWIPLSLFDLETQFVLKFRSFVVDVKIERDEMTLTTFGEQGEYRKVSFHSQTEFELFVKLELGRQLRNHQTSNNGF